MITGLKIDEAQKALYYQKGYWTHESLGDVWARQAKAFANDEYVADDQGTRFTYGEVEDKASRLATWLIEQGVQVGDVVSFQIPNWAEFTIVYVACLKVGAVMHPVAKNFNAADLRFVMNQVSSVAFFCPARFHGCDFEYTAIEVQKDVPSLKTIAIVEKHEKSTSGLPTLNQIIATHEPLTKYPQVDPDSVACLLSTSGTTGRPKAVMLTHNNIHFSEREFGRFLGLTKEDVAFMPSPLNHATGFFHGLLTPMILGGRAVVQQIYHADTAIHLMNEERCTWSMGATPFVYDILHHAEDTGEKPETLRLFCCGGAPVPGIMVDKAHQVGFLLCEVYGSTESCPHAAVPPEKCLEWNGAWSGIPIEGIEVRAVDANGNDVPTGQQGEEISRGPHQFVGYLNNPEKTAEALDDNGWFYSGDLCSMSTDGKIRINGRKKEIIIRGGENISANEIDADLMQMPGMGAHATIGMPDERLGERICTFYVPEDPTRPLTLDQVKEYMQAQGVAKRLWPERIEPIEELPTTPTGKIQRFKLADELKRRMEQD